MVKDFRFHTGEVLPELKLHYVTIGEPTGEPGLVLHGSSGSGETVVGQEFRGPIPRTRTAARCCQYYVIVPDAVGSGKSSKPSNGMRWVFGNHL